MSVRGLSGATLGEEIEVESGCVDGVYRAGGGERPGQPAALWTCRVESPRDFPKDGSIFYLENQLERME